ncbi:tRNA-specific adenosine deaminase TAD1 [Glycine max]|nr:tRNA-specific adenosine deaminase TAD1 [Glycine max]KAH1256131.1 tRNA-specific adenosine deaminase TAD1 [Glycine max]
MEAGNTYVSHEMRRVYYYSPRRLCIVSLPLIGPTNLDWADLCEELLRFKPQEGEIKAWERCPTLAPKRTPSQVENKPLRHMWLRRGNQHIGNDDVRVFRRKLDIMKRALLSYFLQPVYLSSITVGLPLDILENFRLEDSLKRALYERMLPLSNELTSPFLVNQPIFHAAPVPPKDFQQSESAANTLTCGYSICWNECGLHDVIMGTTGRKQGTSAKGALYPSTQSSLCKKRLLEVFLSLGPENLIGSLPNGITYRELKDGAEEYHLASKIFKRKASFNKWFLKPLDCEAFPISE